MRNTHSFKMNLPEMSDPVNVGELNDNFLVIDNALMAGLCKKELTTNNMGSSDPASRKYGWAPWIEIYNGNEFDVVVIDRNAPDLPSGTINIEAGKTHRMFINGTYYMNFYVQDQHDVTFKWFTNAETRINEIEPSGGGGVSSVDVTGASGSHIESSGGPVTDSGTIELSISEGYSIPQTNKQTAWDSKAADLKLEINSSTFVITAQLKDASGNLIGNERTIDLPLESVVVSGDYDEQTKKVILTLQNGSTIEFSVADLVSGLQTELNDTDNKLDPTYIAYDASHRAVSDTEKNTWNAKQNAIDADHKLSSSLVSFTTAEAAALSSGIDSAKVSQISTNQTNILSVEDMVCVTEFSSSTAYAVGDMVTYEHKLYKFINAHQGAWSASDVQNYDLTQLQSEDRAALVDVVDSGAKNLFDLQSVTSSQYGTNNATLVFNSDQTNFTVTATGDFGYARILATGLKPNTKYTLSFMVSNRTVDVSGTSILIRNAALSTTLATKEITANGRVDIEFVVPNNDTSVYMAFYASMESASTTNTYTVSDVMVCTKAAFGVSQKFVPFGNNPFYQIPINHNMIYRGQNLGATLTDAQHTALSSGNFTDLYLGDYWTKTVTIPAGTYTGGDGGEVTVPAQTNITLKAVIADFDTFYAGYASSHAGINTHHAAVIVTGFSNVVWNKTNSTAGGYVASLIHKWLVGSALPQIETWFGSAKVLSHKKLLTNAITGDAASGSAWSSQKISLLSENQMYGSKVWGNSKAANGGWEPGEAFKHLNVFNHIDASLLFGNKSIWLRDIASALWAADLSYVGYADYYSTSNASVAPVALILLS